MATAAPAITHSDAFRRRRFLNWFPMGYGGFVLEYFVNPNRLVNFSVKGLVADGRALVLWHRLDQAQSAVPPAGETTKLLCEVT